jgi:hypothetical protein
VVLHITDQRIIYSKITEMLLSISQFHCKACGVSKVDIKNAKKKKITRKKIRKQNCCNDSILTLYGKISLRYDQLFVCVSVA